jgi:peptidoglycan/xylan/chitin deacetylase (PgdA/CDA1 family)
MLHGIGLAPDRVDPDEKPYWISEQTFAFVLSEMKAHGASLTLDDGNDTDVRIALPKLLEAGLTASFFIPSDRIGTPGYVTEHDIVELHRAGMEIGSHGCAHLNWLKAGDADIARDVTQSVERLSRLIQAPVRSVAVLRRLGIGRVYSSFSGPCIEGAWLVRRDCITANMAPHEISTIMTRKPDTAEAALHFLRIWRRAGNAAIWTA